MKRILKAIIFFALLGWIDFPDAAQFVPLAPGNLIISSADAAKRMPTPEICNGADDDNNGIVDDGCPFSSIFSAVTGGIAADAKDARRAGTVSTATSNESSSGTHLSSTGDYKDGQFALDGSVTGTRYLWAKVRINPLSQQRDRFIWLSTDPFTSSSQNENASFVSDVGLPPAPSFGWVRVGAGGSFSTFTNSTPGASFAFAGAFTLYGLKTSAVEIDCVALMESSSADVGTANPVCKTGAPATGITFNAVGAGVSGSAVTTLAPLITVAAGSNRILLGAVAHRTSTNTISSFSTNLDGALTLLDWRASASGNTTACAVYYKVAPTVGAHTGTVGLSTAQNAVAALIAYNGVSQTSPVGAVTSSSGTVNATHAVSSTVDDLVLAHLCASVDTAEVITPNSTQTERWETTAGVAGAANRVSALSDRQGDTTVDFGWTIGGTKVWVVQAFPLHPPSVAGSAPVVGTPICTQVSPTTATCEASVDDASSNVYAEYDTDTGVPYGTQTATVGTTGGKAVLTMQTLITSTAYFYRLCATNAIGTTCSTEGTFNTTTASAVTALGITAAEIAIWTERRKVGPYRNNSDVSTNSPGDWTRILANATTFLGAPTAEIWSGYTGSGCYSNTPPTGAPPLPGRQRGEKLRDAGFAYLITGTTSYRDAVLTQLLSQASQAGTQFDDNVKWKNQSDCVTGDGHVHEITMWLTKIIYGYDYIRHSISAGNKATLDAWFLAAGIFWENVGSDGATTRFPNRLSDDYTINSSFLPDGDNGQSLRLTHYGGYTAYGFMEAWANRSASIINFAAMAGLLTNNATLKAKVKRWFEEFIKYHLWPDSTSNDFRRWTATSPSLGWHYVGTGLGTMASVADFFARSGDRSLYNYQTNVGLFGTASGATVKSLQKAITLFLQMVTTTTTRYGTDQAGQNGNVNYKIGPNPGISTQSRVHDSYMAQSNVFYTSAASKSYYLRQASGAPAYPSTPATSGEGSAWGGAWNTFPGILFMFGQMEGLHNPYP